MLSDIKIKETSKNILTETVTREGASSADKWRRSFSDITVRLSPSQIGINRTYETTTTSKRSIKSPQMEERDSRGAAHVVEEETRRTDISVELEHGSDFQTEYYPTVEWETEERIFAVHDTSAQKILISITERDGLSVEYDDPMEPSYLGSATFWNSEHLEIEVSASKNAIEELLTNTLSGSLETVTLTVAIASFTRKPTISDERGRANPYHLIHTGRTDAYLKQLNMRLRPKSITPSDTHPKSDKLLKKSITMDYLLIMLKVYGFIALIAIVVGYSISIVGGWLFGN
jgi:hypothetical protein